MYNQKLLDKMSFYLLKVGPAQYYRTNHSDPNYVSIDFTLVDNEIDATLITDVDDIIYLLEDLDPFGWRVQINLGQMYIGEISLANFVEEIGGIN